MRRLAFPLVGEIARDDRDDEVALLGDRDALGMAQRAVLELVAIEPGATDQVGDADGAALFCTGAKRSSRRSMSVTRSTSSSLTTPVSQLPQKPSLGRT